MRLKHIKESRNFKITDPKYAMRTWDGGNEPNNESLPASGETAVGSSGLNENGRQIIAYASVFNQKSKLLADVDGTGEFVLFYEVISPNAFDEILRLPDLDVIYCIDHNPERLISRTKAGNLQLSTDEYGLKFVSTVPNTSEANDLYENIKVGNLQENSFCFLVSPENESWSDPDENGVMTRTILKVDDLLDVSTVVNPAYNNTSISLRCKLALIESRRTALVKQVEQMNDLIESEIFLLKNG
ncbi:MAG: hypothetical protein OJF59_002515 [Cytophagales bacterium]|jgi:HK97 family phage prohead protease|nr:HK97 family phage prohead protease [Bacteroidota bacterium]MBS1980239.1 HK97 family phage prohead protease [Bacteroidota bacterium]WHZ08761.1 MAG: hypothetical protein OJF59_002515 [Cytophagales bacterium]